MSSFERRINENINFPAKAKVILRDHWRSLNGAQRIRWYGTGVLALVFAYACYQELDILKAIALLLFMPVWLIGALGTASQVKDRIKKRLFSNE